MVHIFAAQRGILTEKEASRRLLKQAYEQVFSEPIPPLLHTQFGKPFFAGQPQIHISLSHSKEYVACALSTSRVGIDIEKVRPVKEGIVQRVCAPSERASFNFFSAWVLKESFIKWQGRYTSHFRTIIFSGCDECAHTTYPHLHARVYHDITGYRVGMCVSHQTPPQHVHIMHIAQQNASVAVTILPEPSPLFEAVQA